MTDENRNMTAFEMLMGKYGALGKDDYEDVLDYLCNVDDMTSEQVDAALKAYGYDPIKLVERFKQLAAQELAKRKLQ